MIHSGDTPILDVSDLRTYVYTARGVGRAVDGVTFSLQRGEALGIVGESGSGKSLTAMSIVRLLPPSARIVAGGVRFDGEDVIAKSAEEMRLLRGRRVAVMLQDAQAALNPLLTVGDQLREMMPGADGLLESMVQKLEMWNVSDPRRRLRSYPHELSGGMRQRVMGAIALAASPDVLIADEPTTALDATVQAAVLDQLSRIQAETDLAILFISHDLGVVGFLCNRVAVMYAGRIVESGTREQIFENPAHPYTHALMKASVGVQAGVQRRLYSITGYPPSIFRRDVGCPFAARCPDVMQQCREEYPPEREIEPGHLVACWKYV